MRHDVKLDKETYALLKKLQRAGRDVYPVQTIRRLIWKEAEREFGKSVKQSSSESVSE